METVGTFQLMSATSVEPPLRNTGLGGASSAISVCRPFGGSPSDSWRSRANCCASSVNSGGPSCRMLSCISSAKALEGSWFQQAAVTRCRTDVCDAFAAASETAITLSRRTWTRAGLPSRT